ncbi:MAG: Clp protease ClpS [Planctomycetota bacterium]|nr:MAG: Clp protease ClpS [Planctomycetota bacterium]
MYSKNQIKIYCSEDDKGQTATPLLEKKPKFAPLYHVILWDDNTHTYEYVIKLLMSLFRMTFEKAYQHTLEVDKKGRTICITTHLEKAELKQEQISNFGPDILMQNSKGPMSATIEPAN